MKSKQEKEEVADNKVTLHKAEMYCSDHIVHFL